VAMGTEQLLIFGILGLTLLLFIWGRWRYDIVAMMALLAAAISGVVPLNEAFSGFAHPAVVTVAAILIVSRALLNSGIVDQIQRSITSPKDSTKRQVRSLTGLVAVLSGFMNNVGALAILLPVSLRVSRRTGNPPSALLMPLAFGSLLGGLLTLIGTPPNIIVASYRAEVVGEPFRMFDFTPVGAGVLLAGLLFIWIFGWKLTPPEEGAILEGGPLQDRELHHRDMGIQQVEGRRKEAPASEAGPSIGYADIGPRSGRYPDPHARRRRGPGAGGHPGGGNFR